MCIRLTFLTGFCLFFFCLLVQLGSLLFCLKWDKPRCFPLSTLSTAGFPVLRDLSLRSCTCFLLFLAPLFPYLLVPLYFPSSLSPFLLLPVSLWPSARQRCHHSIASLTGDIKPLCSRYGPPFYKFADDHSSSVTASYPSSIGWHTACSHGKIVHRAFSQILCPVTFGWLVIFIKGAVWDDEVCSTVEGPRTFSLFYFERIWMRVCLPQISWEERSIWSALAS